MLCDAHKILWAAGGVLKVGAARTGIFLSPLRKQIWSKVVRANLQRRCGCSQSLFMAIIAPTQTARGRGLADF